MTTAQIPWLGQLITVTLLPIRPATASTPAKMLFEDAAHAFVQLDAAAKAAGVRLTVNTAYRDHVYQQQLYDAYLAAKAAGQNPSVVARPGTSDHERGLSVDLDTGVPPELRSGSKEQKAASSPTYRWLHNNAAQWGFENDVSSEPWHWTYKNISAARMTAAAAGVAATSTGGKAVGGLLLLGLAWALTRKG